jgi:hypothetical protein
MAFFNLRIDEKTRKNLSSLSEQFMRTKSDTIRFLINREVQAHAERRTESNHSENANAGKSE